MIFGTLTLGYELNRRKVSFADLRERRIQFVLVTNKEKTKDTWNMRQHRNCDRAAHSMDRTQVGVCYML